MRMKGLNQFMLILFAHFNFIHAEKCLVAYVC